MQFSPEKKTRQKKMDSPLLSPLLSYPLMGCVVKWGNGEKTLELRWDTKRMGT